jgi:hypothetical protein
LVKIPYSLKGCDSMRGYDNDMIVYLWRWPTGVTGTAARKCRSGRLRRIRVTGRVTVLGCVEKCMRGRERYGEGLRAGLRAGMCGEVYALGMGCGDWGVCGRECAWKLREWGVREGECGIGMGSVSGGRKRLRNGEGDGKGRGGYGGFERDGKEGQGYGKGKGKRDGREKGQGTGIRVTGKGKGTGRLGDS